MNSAIALLLAVAPLGVQQPPIAAIDVYGARVLSPGEVRRAAGVSVGDSISEDIAERVRSNLAALGIADAQIAVVCCHNGGSILYIGVNEQGAARLQIKAAPTGDGVLPPNIVEAGERFERAVQEAVLSGNAEEDDSLGHSMLRYPAARAVQEEFATFALGNIPLLQEVLRNSANAEQRALAAQILAYAVNKNAIIPDLVSALRDPDETVRNNAMRGLAIMARWAERHPESGLRIPAEPFVDMLNSPFWTDRNKASLVLMSLTATRNPHLLVMLRKQAIDALTDMVHWQTDGHALPAAIILGRMGGLPDNAIFDAFRRDRNTLVEAARNPL